MEKDQDLETTDYMQGQATEIMVSTVSDESDSRTEASGVKPGLINLRSLSAQTGNISTDTAP